MAIYNKLVRDKIPEIIRKDNKDCTIKILNENDFEKALKEKLKEELEEYLHAENDIAAIEELADILELIYALSKAHGANYTKVEEVRQKKLNERGGFEEKIFLIEVED